MGRQPRSALAPTTARPGPASPGAWTRLLAVVGAVGLAVLLAPAAVAAQDGLAADPTLGAALDGEVAGLTATATSDFVSEGVDHMQVRVEITNDTGAPTRVAVPFGTLLATDDDAHQTVAVGGPIDDPTLAQVAQAGGTPVLAAPPGESTHELVVYCTEADDTAPFEPTPLHHLGPADEPLPAVLRAVAAQQPDPHAAQDALWWVTDDATDPVPADLAPLLADIDTNAFAADPHRVVPDTGYTPRWARAAGILDESFEGTGSSSDSDAVGGTGLGALIWVLAAVAAVIAAVVITSRSGREQPAAVTTTRAAGWYPDPWAPGQSRWWDGRTWTSRVDGPR